MTTGTGHEHDETRSGALTEGAPVGQPPTTEPSGAEAPTEPPTLPPQVGGGQSAEGKGTRSPVAAEEDAPAEESDSPTDIYALLGVTSDVTPPLARQMYWSQVERAQEAQQRGEPGAARRLDALNDALAIILDDRRRAEYDRQRRAESGAPAQAAPRFERARRIRAGVVLGVMLLTVAAALVASWLAGPLALAAVVGAGLLAVVAALSWRHDAVAGRSPFTMLGLTEQAGAHEVDVAYEIIAQELLTRVKLDPRAIERLEMLDRAYLQARRALSVRSGQAEPARPGPTVRLLRPVGRALLALLGVLVGWLGSVALVALRAAGGLAGRGGHAMGRGMGRGMQRAAEQLSVLSRTLQGEPEQEPPPPEVNFDADRRLAFGFKAVSERAAGPAGSPAGNVSASGHIRPVTAESAFDAVDEELVEAYLVLEAGAGARRVPIGVAPIRIGSSAACDLMLREELGVAPEHVLVWQREGALLLHVIDTEPGSCLVNERPMTWATLEDGDSITIGQARFHVETPVPAT